ncbi:MAG: ferrous iron transport protein A [Chitinophagales bacterium]|nr:ferrous iron transport protein A [Chitinophagales bacterium]
MKPLHHLKPGEQAYIVDMQNNRICEKLFEHGVFPGDLVLMKQNCEESNSLVIVVNNKTFNLYKPAAETIITNVVSFEVSLN